MKNLLATLTEMILNVWGEYIDSSLFIFANVAYLRKPSGSYHGTRTDNDKGKIKLTGIHVPDTAIAMWQGVNWISDESLLDGMTIRRLRKESRITGKVYTIGFSLDGLRFARLKDCLAYAESKFFYNRGAWKRKI